MTNLSDFLAFVKQYPPSVAALDLGGGNELVFICQRRTAHIERKRKQLARAYDPAAYTASLMPPIRCRGNRERAI